MDDRALCTSLPVSFGFSVSFLQVSSLTICRTREFLSSSTAEQRPKANVDSRWVTDSEGERGRMQNEWDEMNESISSEKEPQMKRKKGEIN